MTPHIMSHDDWLKLTYLGRTSRRGSQLKAIDHALARYHQASSAANLDALRGALITWITEQGANWNSHARNRRNAVDSLYQQVMGIGGTGTATTAEEIAAQEAVETEGRRIVQTLFHGARLEWKSGFKSKLATQKLGTTINTAGTAFNSTVIHQERSNSSGGAPEAARRVFDAIVPSELAQEVAQGAAEIIPNFMTELATAVTPFVGLVTSGGSALYNTFQACRKEYGIYKTRKNAERSLAGVEATSAIDALIRLLERERNADIFSASVSGAEFGGKVVGLLVDAGTATNAAIGLSANLLKLTNILRIVVRDTWEKRKANKAMQGDVDIGVFEKCPLVGCYLICCSPTSVLMSQILERWGDAGWMDEVEYKLDRHVQPLREKARQVIESHRFEIPRLRSYPGLLEVNKKKLQAMRDRVGKSGMVGMGPRGGGRSG